MAFRQSMSTQNATGTAAGRPRSDAIVRNSAPGPDDLTGRTALAGTQAAELSNARTQSQIDAEKARLALEQRRFEADEEMRRQSAADRDSIRELLLKQFGGGGGADGLPGGPSPMMPMPAPVPVTPGMSPVADQGFARAKDRAGLSLQSGLKTLKGVMQSRGRVGSSLERDAVGGLIGGELGRLADVDLASAAEGQRRGYELDERAHGDWWRGREFDEKRRLGGLNMLLSLMTSGRVY